MYHSLKLLFTKNQTFQRIYYQVMLPKELSQRGKLVILVQ